MLAEYETGLDRLALNRSVFREEEGERARDRHADGGASEQEDIWKSRYLAEKKARTDGRRKDRRNQLLLFGRAIRMWATSRPTSTFFYLFPHEMAITTNR